MEGIAWFHGIGVQRPLEYGGLGIHNLETFGWALRIRWFWDMKTDPSRPWVGLQIHVSQKAQAMCNMAVGSVISTWKWRVHPFLAGSLVEWGDCG